LGDKAKEGVAFFLDLREGAERSSVEVAELFVLV